jgi:Secretion system C-terminal sorting domain
MKKLIRFFLIAVTSIPFLAAAQRPDMLWIHGYGGNSVVAPWVARQPDGGFILSIAATTNVGIDPLCPISGNIDIFYKYNADATLLEWTKCYPGNFNDSAFKYMFGRPGGNYVLGASGMGTTSHTYLIRKEDASGALIWRKTYGDSAESLFDYMLPTSDGGYIIAGRVYFTNSDFTVHYGSWMDEDIAVMKIDSNGNKLWSKVIGGSLPDIVAALVSAPGDGCYIAGTTLSTDHDFTGVNHGGDDGFLIRLDKYGNIVWTDGIGGSGGDQLDCAVANGKGGVILSGASNSLDGDRTHFPAYGCPLWVLEVDSSKHVVWNNCYGGGGLNCYGSSLCKATDGSIWVAGVSTLIGGQVDTQYGRDDAWFLHIDSVGNFINARVLGSDLWDRGTMIYPLSNGNVIAGGFYDTCGGTFSSMVTGSTWPYSSAFLTVFSPRDRTEVPAINLINDKITIYPNPATSQLTITSSDEITTVAITNLIGQAVYAHEYNTEKAQVDIAGLPTGVYLVRINGTEIRKFVKE